LTPAALSDCAQVMMLTTFDLDESGYDALRAGASGVLRKDAPPERLLTSLCLCQAGARERLAGSV
jgi:DNA-binding NarL/FixJ family response regulator